MPTRGRSYLIMAGVAFVIAPLLLGAFAAILVYPTLPSLETLTDYSPKIPLRVYSTEGVLIGEFGEEHRALIKIDEVPSLMKKAILAAEDDHFYEHGGVDYLGVLRAAYYNVTSRGGRQGASTITMQVARNFFLTKEKKFSRKFNEALLAIKIEHSLSKDEILQLYINHIYLGQRAYGFAAAAQVYFGKTLDQLNVAEFAMLAGLPKAPSMYNPVVNLRRSKLRQAYVLRRMRELGFIDVRQQEAALHESMVVKHGHQGFSGKADYLAEMVRQEVFRRYQDNAYTQGIKVYTTIRQQDQVSAYGALRKGVLEYDRRHGYRGPEGYIDLHKDSAEEDMESALQDVPDSDDIIPAVVREITQSSIAAYSKGGEIVTIRGEGLKFAQPHMSNKVALNRRLRVGSIIYVQRDEKDAWRVAQLPQVEAAFVSASPRNGAIYALVGGFDFNRNQFNHVTQAWRQPGSSFKPFIYSAALEKGLTPATVINDAPLMISAAETGSEAWQPKNYDGVFDGPMRLRQALIKSKNMISIRILRTITPQYAQDYITKFGFDAAKHPPYLTMALGAGSVTPMQMLTGYSVFANGGSRVDPYFIERIEDDKSKPLYQAEPVVAGESAQQILDVRNAYTMVSLMQDVVRRGTAVRAMQLGRHDLAGKTGTTNDSMDAWFSGFHPTVVGVTWVGFDNPHSLGERETGGGAALPIWMDYMGKTLKNIPEATYVMPENMVAVHINNNGLRDDASDLVEYFYKENIPLR
ncbi:MAG: penicillin-binding protein 1A [Candidatus Nitrotoga sp.]|nr:penicillin-binding protein 1A [Candidatus Nitrotoga sp.]MBP0116853.1 penicillin-binding protein 1A [Candidatus Nitrotoga sp.]MBP0123424.1 penicillin-binding protein 1A [Candidatus Nitrotoga sp.]MBP0125982.1 penicillin-binding protein 1A [Candidatus Nitrotoga sp.]